jgi:hypothetical protein
MIRRAKIICERFFHPEALVLPFSKMGRWTYWHRPGAAIACRPLGDANRGVSLAM